MGNQNRKATKKEKVHLQKIVHEALPGCRAEIGGHGAYGGHRSPRDHTFSFRLVDSKGQYRSNVVWILPEDLAKLTVPDVKRRVDRSNGK